MIVLKEFWREILLAGLVMACSVTAIGWRTAAKLSSEYEAQLELVRADLKVCETAAKTVQESLTTVETARDDFEAKWKAARDTPPEVVTRIKTVTKEIPVVITSPDCEEAAAQALVQAHAFATAWGGE